MQKIPGKMIALWMSLSTTDWAKNYWLSVGSHYIITLPEYTLSILWVFCEYPLSTCSPEYFCVSELMGYFVSTAPVAEMHLWNKAPYSNPQSIPTQYSLSEYFSLSIPLSTSIFVNMCIAICPHFSAWKDGVSFFFEYLLWVSACVWTAIANEWVFSWVFWQVYTWMCGLQLDCNLSAFRNLRITPIDNVVVSIIVSDGNCGFSPLSHSLLSFLQTQAVMATVEYLTQPFIRSTLPGLKTKYQQIAHCHF